MEKKDNDFEKFKAWMNNDEGNYQHPEEMMEEIDFSIIRDGNQLDIEITRNRFYNDKQIVRFLERLIKEKKLPVEYKTTGVIVLVFVRAMIEFYNYSENGEPGKRHHIIITRKDYEI